MPYRGRVWTLLGVREGRVPALCDTVRRVVTHDGFSLRKVVAGPAADPILRGITVDIPNAGITAVVGPSGSGKSTLLRLLNRLDDPLAGEIRWRGQRLDELRPDKLRRQVAMVFQHPPIFAGSVLDNFRVATADTDEGRALHMLDHVGLAAGLLHRNAADLSGGEAQRMCVARALLTDPMVVLADEPTAGLDGEARHTIEKLAQQLAEAGTPLVWVSHDTQQLRRLANHVLVIVDGQVAAFGHLSDLDRSDDPVVRGLVGAP